MPGGRTSVLINDFLGSAHVFAGAVNDIVEKRLLREVAGKQITFSQLKLLKLVAITDRHMVGDVAAFLGVSKAAASKAVDKLVRRHLLLRTEDQADRRAMQVSLTESGRRLLAAYDTARRRKLQHLFRTLTRAELIRTSEVLDRLSAGIVNHHAKPEEVCLKCGIYFREKCLMRDLVRRRCYYQMKTGRGNGRHPEAEDGHRQHAAAVSVREKRAGSAA
jgi:DNA-binding MarR family transcriptional regulator